jgi:hypothetical protein
VAISHKLCGPGLYKGFRDRTGDVPCPSCGEPGKYFMEVVPGTGNVRMGGKILEPSELLSPAVLYKCWSCVNRPLVVRFEEVEAGPRRLPWLRACLASMVFGASRRG